MKKLFMILALFICFLFFSCEEFFESLSTVDKTIRYRVTGTAASVSVVYNDSTGNEIKIDNKG